MQANKNFYHNQPNMINFEKILLTLASDFFNRQIILYQFSNEKLVEEIEFNPSTVGRFSKTFHIVKIQRFKNSTRYLSVFKSQYWKINKIEKLFRRFWFLKWIQISAMFILRISWSAMNLTFLNFPRLLTCFSCFIIKIEQESGTLCILLQIEGNELSINELIFSLLWQLSKNTNNIWKIPSHVGFWSGF